MGKSTFERISPIVPGFTRIVNRFALILGRSSGFAKKWRASFPNFEQLKNREDDSDFNDFLTKSIATSQTFFSKISVPPKILRGGVGVSVGHRPRQKQKHHAYEAMVPVTPSHDNTKTQEKRRKRTFLTHYF